MREKIFALLSSGDALPHKKTLIFLCISLVVLLFLPLDLESEHAKYIPILGWAHAVVSEYCLTALQRSQDAYVISMALDSAIALARTTELSVNVFVAGGSVSPGEILSPLHDSVKTLADFFTTTIVISLIETQAAEALTFICFKFFFPLTIVCYILHILFAKQCQWAKFVGGFLLKVSIFLWLTLPLSAGLANFVDANYITPKYNTHINTLKSEIIAIFKIPSEKLKNIEYNSLKELAALCMETIRPQAGKDTKWSSLLDGVKNLALQPDTILSLLLIMFSQIALLLFVIPIIVLFSLFCTFHIMNRILYKTT